MSLTNYQAAHAQVDDAGVALPCARNDDVIVLCIPGEWTDRSDFLRRIITLEPAGRYMFAGLMLADVHNKDHLSTDFAPADPSMATAFEFGSQGRMSANLLETVAGHKSVVYLYFPRDLLAQRNRMLSFCDILRRAGGIAVKIETSGVAHSFQQWEERLNGTLFDHYTAAITLVGDTDAYYSCGMHNFGFPDCETPASLGIEAGADLMNRFNLWRLDEVPEFEDGHTFSLAADAPMFRMRHMEDMRHEADHLFFNPHGLWRLERV